MWGSSKLEALCDGTGRVPYKPGPGQECSLGLEGFGAIAVCFFCPKFHGQERLGEVD